MIFGLIGMGPYPPMKACAPSSISSVPVNLSPDFAAEVSIDPLVGTNMRKTTPDWFYGHDVGNNLSDLRLIEAPDVRRRQAVSVLLSQSARCSS